MGRYRLVRNTRETREKNHAVEHLEHLVSEYEHMFLMVFFGTCRLHLQ